MESVNGGAQLLIEQAEKLVGSDGVLGLNHWLKVICTRNAGLVESLALDIDVKKMLIDIELELQQLHPGQELPAASVVARAYAQAEAEGREKATERHLIRVILQDAGVQIRNNEAGVSWRKSGENSVDSSTASAIRPRRKTPTLDKFGVDLTDLARQNKLFPLLGRELELQLVMETLCRRTKRNPVLVGPAGVGKTAIVEGLAQLIIQDQVPAVLQETRVIVLQPSNLIAGAGYGDLEKRMKEVIKEAAQPGVILFIDEVHSIIGAGGATGLNDFASLLKPVLSRGEIACVAATTDDEYRRFIETDTALERRFQPIRVQEMNRDQAEQVLLRLREDLSTLHGVKVSDEVVFRLTHLAQQYLRNRYFPDKAVDLLEQCVAYAAVNHKDQVDYDDAETVVFRMIGMPLDVDRRVDALGQRLEQTGWLDPEQIEALQNRLSVTMRGLDLHNNRPNAVILLAGQAAQHSDAMAAVIAESLYGSTQRVVQVDFSRMVHASDISMLIGSPPGYVGYAERTPLHGLIQMPWSVVCWKNIDACHPAVFELIKQSLLQGCLVDARGKPVYFCDTVVIVTTAEPEKEAAAAVIGFNGSQTTSPLEAEVEGILGDELGRLVDVVCRQPVGENQDLGVWIRTRLLAELTSRFSQQGIQITWDDSVMSWLIEESGSIPNQCEKIMDTVVSPMILRQTRHEQDWKGQTWVVKYMESQICLEKA